jgi:streptogramin lyase
MRSVLPSQPDRWRGPTGGWAQPLFETDAETSRLKPFQGADVRVRRPRSLLVLAIPVSLVLLSPDVVDADVSPNSTISTIGGNGVAGFGGDGGPATQARLNHPRDVALGPDGSVYLADTDNHRIRRIAPNGTITTIAGNGSSSYNGDSIPATSAGLYWPHDVTVGGDGVVYIADSAHHRIRRVGLNGTITTIAGTGVAGVTGDGGLAVNARLRNPKSVAVYGGGLFTAGLDNKVRRIDLSSGVITRVAGTGTAGYSGDGGPATEARLRGPQRIAIDSTGDIYIADSLNHRIRRVNAATGVITTVAGTGAAGLSGDGGRATSARVNEPRGVALDGDTVLFIADSNNHRVRRVDLVTGQITTVAGTTRGYSGDGGPGRLARLYQPRGLAVTSQGDLIIADTMNSALRRLSGVADARRLARSPVVE